MEYTEGAYHLAKKSGNFGLRSNGKAIFRKILSGIVNCGPPAEVVLFFRSERNYALTICDNLPFPGPFSQDRVKYAGWNAV